VTVQHTPKVACRITEWKWYLQIVMPVSGVPCNTFRFGATHIRSYRGHP
jgi:hypothetical protein